MGKALSYIDNMLLYSEDPSGREMVDLIRKFLEQVILSGGKINVAKSEGRYEIQLTTNSYLI